METKERKFTGLVMSGFFMLFTNLLMTFGSIALFVYGIVLLDSGTGNGGLLMGMACALLIVSFFVWAGFMMLEPNEARVALWFGKYAGTFAEAGYFWINPFYSTRKLSMRARNLDAEPIKVNDKVGKRLFNHMQLRIRHLSIGHNQVILLQ